jgi:hypothetical protein
MATEQDRRIGEAVIALRAARTQQAVADDMRERGWKWSQATVWSVEKGERPLRLAEAGDLAEVLGADSASDLLLDETEREIERYARWADRERRRIEGATHQYFQALAGFSHRIHSALGEGLPLSNKVVMLAERWFADPPTPEEAVRVGRESAVNPDGPEGSEERKAYMERYEREIAAYHAELLTRVRQLRG